MASPGKAPFIAVACGGTGGHLFPGLAVARALQARGGDVTLFVSRKEVDRRALGGAGHIPAVALPAVGFSARQSLSFLRTLVASCRTVSRLFRDRPPQAVLAMGGFTALPVVLAAWRRGAAAYLHEANAVAGRANRWLAPRAGAVFVGFAEARARLRNARVIATGTPVRACFRPLPRGECRRALGLDTEGLVLLVLGGSQGASAVNRLVVEALPLLRERLRGLQILQLTGSRDFAQVRSAFEAWPWKNRVWDFCDRVDLAMGAADLAVSRAGASCLAELAATQLPAVLVPYPAAADNHQWHNAQAYVGTGAARLLEQGVASPGRLADLLAELAADSEALGRMREALQRWHRPDAADRIVAQMLAKASADAPTASPDRESPRVGQAADGGIAAGGRRRDLRVA